MNFYGSKEMADSFRTVRGNTLVIAEEIGEEHYGFSPAAGARTPAQLLAHIALSTKMPMQIHGVEHLSTLEGFNFPAFFGSLVAEEQELRGKKEIIAALRDSGENFAKWLQGLSEAFLAERVTYPAGMTPASRTRFEMLLSPKEHEMHHRGQLMIIERMVGIVPHMTRTMLERMAAMQQTSKAGA